MALNPNSTSDWSGLASPRSRYRRLCERTHADIKTPTREPPLTPFSEDVGMMRSVCVPFLSGPASAASSFVPLTRSYVLASFFPAPPCHDQFTARHMTAPSASEDLKDFVCNPSLPRFSLPHTKRAFVFSSRRWPPSEIVSQPFASVIPGYCLERGVSPGNLARNLLTFFLFFTRRSVWKKSYMCASVRAPREKEKASKHFENIRLNQCSFVQGP